MTRRTITHYDKHAARYQTQYDALHASDVHAEWSANLSQYKAGKALDIGAGSGRDAAWLAEQGWQVSAVEPAQGLRALGQHKTGPKVQWINTGLPELNALPLPEQGFDLILLSAVWMHLAPEQRPLAFKRLTECVSAEGMIIITLLFGPSDPKRPMYVVSVEELKQFTAQYDFTLEEMSKGFSQDYLHRNVRLTLLTSDYMCITDPKALRKMMLLAERGADIRVFETGSSESFHLKAYIFFRSQIGELISADAFGGSGNISART